MTIGGAVFALVLVYTLAILVYILGVALFITRARYLDLKKHYSELPPPNLNKPKKNSPIALASPIKLHKGKLLGETIPHNSNVSTPISMETRAIIIGLAKLPMSSIIRRFAGLSINKEKNLLALLNKGLYYISSQLLQNSIILVRIDVHWLATGKLQPDI